MQQLKLIPCTKEHIYFLSTWCSSLQEVEQWAGPDIRFPYTPETFLMDIKYQELSCYGLINQKNELVAFGQFYERLSNCHLGRLIVNPHFRGQGIAKKLVIYLSKQAISTLKLHKLSLFVYSNNVPALTLYKKLGFIEKDYPENLSITNCLYLTKENDIQSLT